MPIGTLLGVAVDSIKGPGLAWDRILIEEVRLSRAAAMLVVQGLPLSHLFPPDLTAYDGARPVLWFRAPPVLLHCSAVGTSQVPPKLQGVVLGVVVHTEGLSEDEIRARMLANVLG
jgi:hypothetical protein